MPNVMREASSLDDLRFNAPDSLDVLAVPLAKKLSQPPAYLRDLDAMSQAIVEGRAFPSSNHLRDSSKPPKLSGVEQTIPILSEAATVGSRFSSWIGIVIV